MRYEPFDQLVYTKLGTYYPDLLRYVGVRGARVRSRLGEAKELVNLRLVLTQPEHCLVARDGMSDEFAREEIVQLLAGRYDRERLAAVVARAAELITDATAYGPRVVDQVYAVETELTRDPSSRRAVVYVGNSEDLRVSQDPDRSEATAGEMPCTCTWQFLLRDGLLHMTVSMRSWDLVWGLSYDVPSFVAVQLALCGSLDAQVGTYVHSAGSAHVYERHYGLRAHERFQSVRSLTDDLIGWSYADTVRNARREMRS